MVSTGGLFECAALKGMFKDVVLVVAWKETVCHWYFLFEISIRPFLSSAYIALPSSSWTSMKHMYSLWVWSNARNKYVTLSTRFTPFA